MIGGRRVLAVMPARGGSKGIKLKNLREVAGKSLVAWVGDVVAKVPEIDRAVVSTDHDGIAAAAEAAGIAAPFRRPPELSGDRIGDWDVLHHALLESERLDRVRYDVVLMLQPTSPLREPRHVRDTLDMFAKGNWDSIWTLSPTDSKAHPLKQLKVDAGAMDYYDPEGAAIVARQQLRPVYHRNGIAYAISRECLCEQKSIKGRKAGALVLDGDFVSIDTEWDIELVEFILSRRNRRS